MKLFLVTIALSMTCFFAIAQEAGRKLFYDIDLSMGIVQRSTMANCINIDIGYQDKRFLFYGLLSSGSLLHYSNTPRTFVPLGDISVGAGLKIVSFDMIPGKPYALHVRANIGTSLCNWKYNVYEYRISLSPLKHFGPTLGLGYRRYKSNDDDRESQNVFYLSAGVRF